MAKNKKPEKKVVAPLPPIGSVNQAGFGIKDYFVMNIAMAVFCLVQMLIVRVLLRDFAGLYFFFGFIMCAFLLASIFDYFAEKLNVGACVEENG